MKKNLFSKPTIAMVAVFSKVEWKPITHNVVRSVSDVVGNK